MPGCIHNIFFCQDLPFAEVGEALRRDGRIVVVENIASVLNPFIVTELFIFEPLRIVYIGLLRFISRSSLDAVAFFSVRTFAHQDGTSRIFETRGFPTAQDRDCWPRRMRDWQRTLVQLHASWTILLCQALGS